MKTPDLSTNYLGLHLKNPIIASSSGMTDSVKKISNLEKNGIAAVVLKSLFEEEIILEMEETIHSMTGRSKTYPESFYYINKDIKPKGIGRYLEFIGECKSNVSIPIIASINCISDQKWTYFAKKIEQAGADALELNIFQLTADFKREPQDHLKTLQNIVDKVLQATTIPVALKIGPYVSDLGSTIRRLSETGIKGIVLFNRSFSPDFDIEKLTITNSNVLSSPSELHLSLRWIALMSQYVKCDLAASTGVHHGDAVIKQLLGGAKVIQIASTLYKNGPDHINVMLRELSNWMMKHNFHNLNDFRGKLSSDQSRNPAALERVQFMKYFRDFVEESQRG